MKHHIDKNFRRKYDPDELQEYVASRFCINGPSYRGARMPAPISSCVNEANFDDALRFKNFEVEAFQVSSGAIEILIDWVTQEPFDGEWGAETLWKEILRWAEFNFRDFSEDVYVTLYVECRDGGEYGYASFRERLV